MKYSTALRRAKAHLWTDSNQQSNSILTSQYLCIAIETDLEGSKCLAKQIGGVIQRLKITRDATSKIVLKMEILDA